MVCLCTLWYVPTNLYQETNKKKTAIDTVLFPWSGFKYSTPTPHSTAPSGIFELVPVDGMSLVCPHACNVHKNLVHGIHAVQSCAVLCLNPGGAPRALS